MTISAAKMEKALKKSVLFMLVPLDDAELCVRRLSQSDFEPN